MLLYGIELPALGPGTHISQSWRLYGDTEPAPTDAFAAFLVEFGLDVTVDDMAARFVATTRARSASTSLEYDVDRRAEEPSRSHN